MVERSISDDNFIPQNIKRDDFVVQHLPRLHREEDITNNPFYENYLLLMIGCVGAIDAHKLDELPDKDWTDALIKVGREYDIPEQLLSGVLPIAKRLQKAWDRHKTAEQIKIERTHMYPARRVNSS